MTSSSLGDRDPPPSRTLPVIKGGEGGWEGCGYVRGERGEEGGHGVTSNIQEGVGVGVEGGRGGVRGGGKRGGGGVKDLKKVRQQVVYAGVGLFFETHVDGVSLSAESEAKSKGGGSKSVSQNAISLERTWVNPYSFHIGENKKNKTPSN